MNSATYMPSAKNEPCARLIVSITPDDQHEAERDQREQQPQRDAVDQVRQQRGSTLSERRTSGVDALQRRLVAYIS